MIFLIPLMAFIARGAGADWFKLKTVFGLLFGLAFGFTAYNVYGHWVAGLLGFLVSWRGFEFGHGTFYAMIGYHDHNRDPSKPDVPRIQTLEKVVRPIYTRLGGDIYNPLYSWVCMGVKGLLIGLAAGWYGLLLAVLWPFAYWVGHRIEKQPEVAEWISGMFAGLIIAMALT